VGICGIDLPYIVNPHSAHDSRQDGNDQETTDQFHTGFEIVENFHTGFPVLDMIFYIEIVSIVFFLGSISPGSDSLVQVLCR
jgi:hypothetical protein